MGLLSTHEAIVWREFQSGKTTREIAEATQDPEWLYSQGVMDSTTKSRAHKAIHELEKKMAQAETESQKKKILRERERVIAEWAWTPAYVSRVMTRARKKIERILRDHATSHRLDVESVLDYKGLLIGFDYQANTQVYIVFTIELGVIVWYKHDSFAGKDCVHCPKEKACRKTLDTIVNEYNLTLREDELGLPMTQQSIVIFHKLAAKEVPRYKRKE